MRHAGHGEAFGVCKIREGEREVCHARRRDIRRAEGVEGEGWGHHGAAQIHESAFGNDAGYADIQYAHAD